MVVGIRVESQNIQTGKVKHCNSSYFTMVAKSDKNKQVTVPGIIINNEKEMRRFLEAIKRLEMKKKRQEEFNSDNFVAENYIEDLEKYNVKIEL